VAGSDVASEAGQWADCVTADGSLDVGQVARRLVTARTEGRTISATLVESVGLGLGDAYRVQDEVTALRLARGERVVGWKLGYTSLAMREQMGISEPNLGPLTDAMLLPSGSAVPSTALQPRVEPEIGLRLARDLSGPCSAAAALAACAEAVACLEVVDSVWTGYRFALEDNTADGSSAAWVVVGDRLPMDDLPALQVELAVDGSAVAAATGAAAGGHPAVGLAWLAGQLALRGSRLRAGDLVITGGLTAAYPLLPAGEVRARFRWPVPGSVGRYTGQPASVSAKATG
jgi:2-keto-4-pentenoate hydratase